MVKINDVGEFIEDISYLNRGVGTGGPRGPRPPQKFRRLKKCPLFSGKVPFFLTRNKYILSCPIKTALIQKDNETDQLEIPIRVCGKLETEQYRES